MTPVPDLYRILQVDPEAEPEVIRAAYLCLAKKYHPDRGGGTGEQMVALNSAWAVLGNTEKRAAYHRSQSAPAGSSVTPPTRTDQGEAKAVYARPGPAHTVGSTGTTLDFGRYAGWTLDALARADPDYLEWLARAPIGMRYRAEIHALLAARRPTAAGAPGQGRGRTQPSSPQGRTHGRRLPWHARPWADR